MKEFCMNLHLYLIELSRNNYGIMGRAALSILSETNPSNHKPDAAPFLIGSDIFMEHGEEKVAGMLKRLGDLVSEMGKLEEEQDAVSELMKGKTWGPDATYLFKESFRISDARKPLFGHYLWILYHTDI